MELVTPQHIECDPNRCGGKPCIKGTRIRVWDVYVASEIAGKNPSEIVADYPHVTLADVHAALAYYWDHQDEINTQMRAADDYVEQLKRAAGPSLLATRLASLDTPE